MATADWPAKTATPTPAEEKRDPDVDHHLEQRVAQHQVLRRPRPTRLLRQALALDVPRVGEAAADRAREEPVHAFAEARRGRIARRADVPMVALDVLDGEVRIRDAREQDVAERPLVPVAAVDQLVRERHPDGAGGRAHRHGGADDFVAPTGASRESSGRATR